jgi:hypothetical protein
MEKKGYSCFNTSLKKTKQSYQVIMVKGQGQNGPSHNTDKNFIFRVCMAGSTSKLRVKVAHGLPLS